MTDIWATFEVEGFPCDLFEPASPRAAALFLHGYDGLTLANRDVWTTALSARGIAVACPRAGPQWWLDRPCGEALHDGLIMTALRTRLIPALKQRWTRANPLAVFGWEMGGQGALQLGYRFPQEFPVVAALSPLVNFETWYGRGSSLDELFPNRESARQETAILQLKGLNQPRRQWIGVDPTDAWCAEGSEILHTKLTASGIPHQYVNTRVAGGYGWQYVDAMAEDVCRFLADPGSGS